MFSRLRSGFAFYPCFESTYTLSTPSCGTVILIWSFSWEPFSSDHSSPGHMCWFMFHSPHSSNFATALRHFDAHSILTLYGIFLCLRFSSVFVPSIFADSPTLSQFEVSFHCFLVLHTIAQHYYLVLFDPSVPTLMRAVCSRTSRLACHSGLIIILWCTCHGLFILYTGFSVFWEVIFKSYTAFLHAR